MSTSNMFYPPNFVMSENIYPHAMEESSLSCFDEDEFDDFHDMGIQHVGSSFSTQQNDVLHASPAHLSPLRIFMPLPCGGDPCGFDFLPPVRVSPEPSFRKIKESDHFAPIEAAEEPSAELEKKYQEGFKKLRESMKKSEVTRRAILEQRLILRQSLDSEMAAPCPSFP
eukprot:scaffold992_cov116-Cylindrotheca_fusiformis.AAC.12